MNPATLNIVVTGVGLVTPLGASRELSWRRLLANETGIQPTEHGLEARVVNFSLNGARSRMGDFALLAAREALAQADLDDSRIRALRVGCAVSQSKPIVESVSTQLDPELLMSEFFGWSPTQVLMRYLNIIGPSTNVVAACATGVASIAAGEHWLRENLCDVVLVGASESSLNDFYRSGFRQMGVLADGGFHSVRPFDRTRRGFAMGEGAAVLVLEREEHARARAAKPLAQLTKTVLRQSGGDILRFDETGTAVAALIRATCSDSVPGYINAHGTGTLFNDAVEARGIALAFGPRAGEVAISSTKAATGHLLGAAGAVEAALAVLALRDQVVPSTLNLDEPDDGVDLNFVTQSSRRIPLESALSLSYGFGGQMGAVLFSVCH